MGGPLSGVNVVEFEGKGPAPFACRMLADLGASVTVIARPRAGAVHERLLGDDDNPLRLGKRILPLDLRSGEGREQARALVRAADALVEGYRPGVMERLGFGPADCAELNPALVYGRLSGWGQAGPSAGVAGHELNYLAMAGILDLGPRADEPPRVPATMLGDAAGALTLAFGLMCALIEARRTGRGRVVDGAIVDAAALLGTIAQWMRARGQMGATQASLFYESPFYDVYRCADDRFVAVAALEPEFYRQLLAGLGVQDVDPAQQFERAGWPRAKERIAAAFRGRDRDEWCRCFDGTDACVTPVLTMEEAADHPHNVARGLYRRDAAGALHPAPAPRFLDVPPAKGATAGAASGDERR